jgi:Conserved TM helix
LYHKNKHTAFRKEQLMQTITNWGVAMWTSLTSALTLVFSFIPKLLGFLVILLVGWLVASAFEKIIAALLRKVGFDRMADRIGLTRLEQRMNLRMDAAGLLAKIVYWFVFLVFLVPAVEALGLSSISSLLGQLIAYIPNVFVAILILFLGTLAATFVADLIRGAIASANVGNANVFANIARYTILGFVAIIALEQLQIAPAILNILFTAIVGALALAFGLAFGLGGRESAQRWLMRGESNLTTTATRSRVQQEAGTETPVEQSTSTRYSQKPYPQR